MAHTGLYVFGTSVLWGQGHDRATKLHTRLATWLRGRHSRTVAVRHFAHSGAVLVGGSRAMRLHGEVPTPFPSVLRQIRLAPPPTEERVCVLAAIGHPNKRGVTRYLRGVKQALNNLGPGV